MLLTNVFARAKWFPVRAQSGSDETTDNNRAANNDAGQDHNAPPIGGISLNRHLKKQTRRASKRKPSTMAPMILDRKPILPQIETCHHSTDLHLKNSRTLSAKLSAQQMPRSLTSGSKAGIPFRQRRTRNLFM